MGVACEQEGVFLLVLGFQLGIEVFTTFFLFDGLGDELFFFFHVVEVGEARGVTDPSVF